jgi:hypothetical protein
LLKNYTVLECGLSLSAKELGITSDIRESHVLNIFANAPKRIEFSWPIRGRLSILTEEQEREFVQFFANCRQSTFSHKRGTAAGSQAALRESLDLWLG